MPFANSIVGGVTLVRPAIRSPDYVPGVSGWSINRDGSVEFSNGTFRGTITATEIIGSVFGTSTTDPSLWLNEDNANSLRVYDASGELLCEIGANLGSQASAVFYDRVLPRAISIGEQIQWLRGPGVLTQFGALYQSNDGIIFNTITQGGVGFDVSNGQWRHVTSGTDDFEDWHTVGATGEPAFGADWSGSTTFNAVAGFDSLRFKKLAEGQIWVMGAFATGATVPSNPIFTLPTGYRPAAISAVNAARGISGTFLGGMLQVSTSGNLNAGASVGLPIAANATYYINGVFPYA